MAKKKAKSQGVTRVLDDILKKSQIRVLREAYDNKGEDRLLALFNGFMPMHIPATLGYAEAIGEQFYSTGVHQKECNTCPPTPRVTLSRADRERCLVAVLTARGPDANLGVHIYMALMHGVPVSEIAELLFLAGVYSGVDNLTEAIKVAHATLTVLADLLKSPDGAIDPISILKAIEEKI